MLFSESPCKKEICHREHILLHEKYDRVLEKNNLLESKLSNAAFAFRKMRGDVGTYKRQSEEFKNDAMRFIDILSQINFLSTPIGTFHTEVTSKDSRNSSSITEQPTSILPGSFEYMKVTSNILNL